MLLYLLSRLLKYVILGAPIVQNECTTRSKILRYYCSKDVNNKFFYRFLSYLDRQCVFLQTIYPAAKPKRLLMKSFLAKIQR